MEGLKTGYRYDIYEIGFDERTWFDVVYLDDIELQHHFIDRGGSLLIWINEVDIRYKIIGEKSNSNE